VSGGDLPAAFGGPGWSPRRTTLREEIGSIWGPCGIDSEWGALRRVLLHRPGPELEASRDPAAAQMLAPVDPAVAARRHDGLAAAYRRAGVAVEMVDPEGRPPANLLFVADLFLMTPEGAILGRPASTVRAGEERHVARRLAALGVPILRTVRGAGTFEGADALWLRRDLVMLATGFRTNREGARQVAACLGGLGVRVAGVVIPPGAMHLMGTLRLLDWDLAVGWPGRVPDATAGVLRDAGFTVHEAPGGRELERGQALNLVTLGPRRVVMAAGNPVTRRFLEDLGVACVEVEIAELTRAAGGIACMTGVLEREPAAGPGGPA